MTICRSFFLYCALAAAAGPGDRFYREGLEHLDRGDTVAARQALLKAVEADSRHAGAWKALGVVAAAQGEHAAAEPAFAKACDLQRTLPDACFYHGRVLYLLNRFDEALRVLEKLVPADPRAYRVLALSLEGLGRWNEAEAAFLTAIRSNAPGEDPSIDFGVALMRQGKTTQALQPLLKAVDNNPKSPRARLELGRVLFQLDRQQEAIAHLEAAVRLDPRASAAHQMLGRLYMRAGKADLAQQHLKLAVQTAR